MPEGYILYPMEYGGSIDPAASEYEPDLIDSRLVESTQRISYLVSGKRSSVIVCREASCRKAKESGRCPLMKGEASTWQEIS